MNQYKKFISILAILCFMHGIVWAQQVINITSTGKTTGHIATLTVTNPSNKTVNFTLGMSVIPSRDFKTAEGTKKSQPQIHTGNINRELRPGETAEIPINGFCLDVRKPALTEGETFPLLDDWVMEVPTAPELENQMSDSKITINELSTAYKPSIIRSPIPLNPDSENSEWGLTFPGTEDPFNYTIDISKHAEDAALVIFPMVNNIISSYKDLKEGGLISTPFSGNADKEKEAVLQQSIWMVTSLLQGESYTKEDFTERMSSQFQEASGIDIEEAPKEQKEKLGQGVDQFWGVFELVGEKAKVLKKNPVAITEQDPTIKFRDEENAEIECGCDRCVVVVPLKIFNNETGEEITEDTIVRSKYDIRIEPQQSQSNCTESCISSVTNGFVLDNGDFGVSKSESYILRKDHQSDGQMIIVSRSFCYCESSQSCAENRTEKIMFFSKNCCDELKHEESSGWGTDYLNFEMENGQYVRMAENGLTISVLKNGTRIHESFEFDINIESIFCNLDEDRVINILDQNMSSQSSTGTENSDILNSSSLGFAGPTNDIEGFNRGYRFRFMKSVMIEGRRTELQVSISVDEETCEAMISVRFGNQIYEHSGDPLYSLTSFRQELENLGSPNSSYYWNRLLFLYSESFKYQDGTRQQVLESVKDKIREGINLRNNLSQAEKNAWLQSLENSTEPQGILMLLNEISNSR